MMIDLGTTLDLKNNEIESFLKNLQGNILKSHGRSYTKLLFLKFKQQNVYLVRNWLAQLASKKYVTSAWDQWLNQLLSKRYSPWDEHLKQFVPPDILNQADYQSGPFCMVLLSYSGYKKLYKYDLGNDALPRDPSFKLAQSSLSSSKIPTSWKDSYQEEFDALLLLADDDKDKILQLKHEIEDKLGLFNEFSYIVQEFDGTKLPKEGVYQPGEHFGFADGISQPLFVLQDVEGNRKNIQDSAFVVAWKPATSLNQVFVQETQKHDDGSTTYGSYLAFYKIAQDSELFEQTFPDPNQAANAIGRKRDGTPLIYPAEGGQNNFNYQKDLNGAQCPLNAHIRKANDRNTSPRIARRGIAYNGPQDQGILFMSFQANLQEQFISLLEQVADDALLSVPGLVSPIMGAYFYAPSIKSLQEMATLRSDQQKRLNIMLDNLIMDDAKLKAFAETWEDGDKVKAGMDVGILPDDLYTAYSILRIGDEKMAADIAQGKAQFSNVIPNPYDNACRKRHQEAFKKLIDDPNLLQDFIKYWSTDLPRALDLVHLTKEDEQALYKHFEDKQFVLKWRFWG